MTGERFKYLVTQAFNSFLSDLGLRPEKIHLSGRYHRASFIGKEHTLIVSFELGDSYLTAMLVQNDDDLVAIDDPQRTPRLDDLNSAYMGSVTSSERAENESFFSSIKAEDYNEKVLLKCAKDLRLVLPRHLRMISKKK